MSMKDFVRRAEISSKENIRRAYSDIDFLYWQIDFLNDLLNRYSNKTSGKTLTVYQRQDEMARIREQIPRVYQDINYYKECINAEKKEMKRIYDTYGFGPAYQPYYEKREKTQYYSDDEDTRNDFVDNYNDSYEYENEYSDSESDAPPPQDELEELEEIKDYKYNPVTDTWE